MSGYLARLKALKSEICHHDAPTKPTKPAFVSFDSNYDIRVSEHNIIFPTVKTAEINPKGETTGKGDVLDFPSEWLKRFDETTLERLAIMTVDGGLSDEDAQMEIVEPETDMKSSWPPENQVLIDWFVHLEPPTEPFYLEPHIHVIDPAKYFASLKREIESGPSCPRGRNGALLYDLNTLRKKTALN